MLSRGNISKPVWVKTAGLNADLMSIELSYDMYGKGETISKRSSGF